MQEINLSTRARDPKQRFEEIEAELTRLKREVAALRRALRAMHPRFEWRVATNALERQMRSEE